MAFSAMNKTGIFAAALFAGNLAGPAASQESAASYPSKPIALVFNTTGPTSADIELRWYQEALKNSISVPLIFDYRGGGNGTIGALLVARARPDGYSYLATASTIVTTPFVMKDAGYEVLKDFEPVTMMSKKNFMVLVHPSGPYQNIRDYVAYVRANPGKVNWSTSGDGSSTHLPGIMLHSATQTQVTFVPYKVSNDRLLDLIAGRVQITVGTVLASMGFVKAGKLRPLAVTDSERSKLLPDLPTIAQSGIPELSDFQYATWLGLFAPAKTPANITGKFQSFLKQASTNPFVMKSLDEADTVQVVNNSSQFKQFLVAENGRLEKAMKAAGMTPN